MVEGLIILALVGLVCVVLIQKMPDLLKKFSSRKASDEIQTQSQRFSCMVQSEYEIIDNKKTEVFVVKMRGKITTPRDMYDTDVQVLIADITDGEGADAKPVLCTEKDRQMDDSPAFCQKIHNGKIPQKITILPKWIKVASIPCNILEFPGGGIRKLVFVTSLLSHENGNEFLSTSIVMHYENDSDGYVDKLESLDKPIALSIQLACQVAATGRINTEAANVIKDWINSICQGNKNEPENSSILEDMVQFGDMSLERIANGENFDIAQICGEMLEFSTILDRYNLVKLCLNIIATDSYAHKAQTDIIINIANLLILDQEKISAMAQKILTIDKYKVDDIDFLLGIHEHMDAEQARLQINKEYQKWNGRVTHPDHQIRLQADLMLKLIAEVRSKVMGQASSV